MEEMFDVVDNDGNITGEIVSRSDAHKYGYKHRTTHTWLVRNRNNQIEILCQLRSPNKDSYPNCYDISTAGHIPAGVDYLNSAIREAKEELGVTLTKEQFIYCGTRRYDYVEIFHDEPFHDNEVTNVYIVYVDDPVFTLQKEEVSAVKWFDFKFLYDAVLHDTFNHCIMMEEMDMIKKKLYEKKN